MNSATKFDQVRHELGGLAIRWDEHHDQEVYIEVAPGNIPAACTRLFDNLRLRFVIISGSDTQQGFELLYHFADDSQGAIITLRTMLPGHEDPHIASITSLITGASWVEREIHELLGIHFDGHPSLKHLLLGDDWPANNYPLRQDNEQKRER
jgi:NADH-quinone oxidoreductase subunit C